MIDKRFKTCETHLPTTLSSTRLSLGKQDVHLISEDGLEPNTYGWRLYVNGKRLNGVQVKYLYGTYKAAIEALKDLNHL